MACRNYGFCYDQLSSGKKLAFVARMNGRKPGKQRAWVRALLAVPSGSNVLQK